MERPSSIARMLPLPLLLLALSFVLATAPPFYNWDLLAYVAIAEELRGAPDPHGAAYRAVREAAPPAAFDLLLGSERRATTAADPQVFSEVLRYYRIKPAYPTLMAVLPGNPARTSVYVSGAAWLGLALLLWAWSRRRLGGALAALGTVTVMCSPFALDLARLSTPDALSALLVLTAFWLLYEYGWYWGAMVVLLGSLLVRPDNIFWVLPVAVWWAARGRVGIVPTVLIAAVAALVVATLGEWAGNYGWATLFEQSFVQPQRALPDPAPTLTFGELAHTYLRQGHPAFLPRFLLLFAALGALLAWRVPAARELVALAAASIVLRWLIFPSTEERLYASAYFVILLALTRHAPLWLRPAGSTNQEDRALAPAPGPS